MIYSTTDGHTLRICHKLKQIIEARGHELEIVAIKDSFGLDLQRFDKIVIGASIRYGKHSPLVFEFIRRNQTILDSKPNAFFSVNVVARKPEKNQPHTNPYVRSFLKKITWKPKAVAVFAGKIDYPRYSPLDRLIIRFIMWMTRGPTDPKAVAEFTDWRQVEAFGHMLTSL